MTHASASFWSLIPESVERETRGPLESSVPEPVDAELFVCSFCNQPFARDYTALSHIKHKHWSPTLQPRGKLFKSISKLSVAAVYSCLILRLFVCCSSLLFCPYGLKERLRINCACHLEPAFETLSLCLGFFSHVCVFLLCVNGLCYSVVALFVGHKEDCVCVRVCVT